ncbi:Ldh family oxidoreductase [Amycolatopsis viridis]|uniref:LDH2 family malate/lactate/ureidoglycolate dehydrogenase n=1 Tax=Amycolatopsis viridis TaxID=185678 RepID=A0ABX0SPJ0_9PSEU|nr:Ldh family oxidoreductase [Amycolatopsis viridis]NIH78459.1 LDH2 family malate/lactate/ureidoglycolate dehydrogenase [Amycolatopsis viridis]
MPAVKHGDLTVFATRVLSSIGMPADHAAATAECLVSANLRGLDSHGVLRLLQYAETVREGRVRPDPAVTVRRPRGGHPLVDAGGGYGYVPTLLAADLAVRTAAERGVGVAGVRNSHHFGMGATYVERIARAGLAGIVLSNTGPVLAPPGVRRPLLGNNPLAIAIPRRAPHPPIVLDMAMSQTAFGRIRLAAAESREIPEGWALDADGRPTTDARTALAAGLLAPMGGHKGFGLALIVDLLAGVLTGSRFGARADAHDHPDGGVGHLVIAISPELFLDRTEFETRVEELVGQLRAGDVRDAVLLPGEREQHTERERRRHGIEISADLAAQLAALARTLGVPDPFDGSES